jgi:hypothetical protein
MPNSSRPRAEPTAKPSVSRTACKLRLQVSCGGRLPQTLGLPMRLLLLTVAILFPALCFSDDSQRIAEIKEVFSQWQPIIQSKTKERFVIYRYASGANYERQEWSRKELKSDDKALSDKYTILRKGNGAYVNREQYSFSGDWFVLSEHYYDKNGKILFVFWKMNTFQADEPATIEKRLYFADNGKVIRNLKEVYKLNTNQKQNASFMDHDVEYSTDFKSLEFFDQLPKHP